MGGDGTTKRRIFCDSISVALQLGNAVRAAEANRPHWDLMSALFGGGNLPNVQRGIALPKSCWWPASNQLGPDHSSLETWSWVTGNAVNDHVCNK